MENIQVYRCHNTSRLSFNFYATVHQPRPLKVSKAFSISALCKSYRITIRHIKMKALKVRLGLHKNLCIHFVHFISIMCH